MFAWLIALLSVAVAALLILLAHDQLRTRFRDDANKRARKLLLEHLTPEQLKQFKQDETFEVVSNLDNRFRILPVAAFGIYRLHADSIQQYCALPQGVPIYDVMLAQKFLIETDESAFLKVARGPFPRRLRDRHTTVET